MKLQVTKFMKYVHMTSGKVNLVSKPDKLSKTLHKHNNKQS